MLGKGDTIDADEKDQENLGVGPYRPPPTTIHEGKHFEQLPRRASTSN
jgi:hypothetical protein